MYFVIVIATTIVLPIGLALLDYQLNAGLANYSHAVVTPSDMLYYLAKWYVFWAGGVRLLSSGLRQTLGPQMRRKPPVEIEHEPYARITQRLGFTKLLIGLLCIATEFVISLPSNLYAVYFPAAVVAAGLFYGLSALHYIRMPSRTARQMMALVTDMLVFAVLAAFFALYAAGVASV